MDHYIIDFRYGSNSSSVPLDNGICLHVCLYGDAYIFNTQTYTHARARARKNMHMTHTYTDKKTRIIRKYVHFLFILSLNYILEMSKARLAMYRTTQVYVSFVPQPRTYVLDHSIIFRNIKTIMKENVLDFSKYGYGPKSSYTVRHIRIKLGQNVFHKMMRTRGL